MATWKKFKSRQTEKTMLISPKYSKKELRGRKVIGIKIDINNEEVILSNQQLKELISCLVQIG